MLCLTTKAIIERHINYANTLRKPFISMHRYFIASIIHLPIIFCTLTLYVAICFEFIHFVQGVSLKVDVNNLRLSLFKQQKMKLKSKLYCKLCIYHYSRVQKKVKPSSGSHLFTYDLPLYKNQNDAFHVVIDFLMLIGLINMHQNVLQAISVIKLLILLLLN